MSTLTNLFRVTCFIFLAFNLAAAQNGRAETTPDEDGVEIVVVDASGARIKGANVSLLDPDGKALVNAVTNGSGVVHLANGPTGKLVIRADAKGFKRVEMKIEDRGRVGSTLVLALQYDPTIELDPSTVILIVEPDATLSTTLCYLCDLPFLSQQRRDAFPFPLVTPLPPPRHRKH